MHVTNHECNVLLSVMNYISCTHYPVQLHTLSCTTAHYTMHSCTQYIPSSAALYPEQLHNIPCTVAHYTMHSCTLRLFYDYSCSHFLPRHKTYTAISYRKTLYFCLAESGTGSKTSRNNMAPVLGPYGQAMLAGLLVSNMTQYCVDTVRGSVATRGA